MSELQISEAFAVLAQWAAEQGAVNLRATPGLWEGRLADKFNVAINAHREDLRTKDGLTVPPFHIAVNAPEYLGAVMLVSAVGGMGAPGMEDDVIAAATAALAENGAR